MPLIIQVVKCLAQGTLLISVRFNFQIQVDSKPYIFPL